ncbi:MAG: HypC/HybG/HupF family hydrogenase formation chaperone [Deltaproteobacteria bacterium]|nr:HypC/HybG/HupF family hydrogenase formation chaperone [Deltaproteobacteria bacterium]
MCLAIPMRLVSREGNKGIAEVGGVRTEVRLDLVEVEVGQSLIVHAGFAIQVLDEDDASERLELLRQIAGLVDEASP